jgi:hypothetical protein
MKILTSEGGKLPGAETQPAKKVSIVLLGIIILYPHKGPAPS